MCPEVLDPLEDNLDGYRVGLREEFPEFKIFPDFFNRVLLFPATDVLRRTREELLGCKVRRPERVRAFPEP